jgi:hypothetical protein
MPLQWSRTLTVESACCAGGGSFRGCGAGSSPAAFGRSSSGRAQSPPPPWFPGRRSHPVSCGGWAYFLWREGPSGLPFESAPLVHSVH